MSSLSRKRYELERVYPCLPKTTRGQSIVIGGDPKGKNFVYTYGNSVIIRNIENPSIVDIYTQHSVPTTVAKYSPNGFYIASADQVGKVRIWDTINPTHILKNEYHPIAGPIRDLAWSPDSQRIVVVGEGKEKFAHVFSADTGTSLGDMIGHSRPINTCDYKPTRPFKIISGSDEGNIVVHQGPPFKFQCTLEEHKKFIFCLRFSPTENKFASASGDGRIAIFDSENYEKIGELGSPAHAGSVYSICWSPDGTQMLSASGDKTAKIWDVESQKEINTVKFGNDIDDMQVGCLWQGSHLITISLSGYINYLAPDKSTPIRVIQGHNRPITAMCVTSENEFVTGSVDGHAVQWSVDASKDPQRFTGHGHKSQINYFVSDDSMLVSCSVDDTIKFTPLGGEAKWGDITVKLDSQPRQIALLQNGDVVCACFKGITFLDRDGKVGTFKAQNYEPLSVKVNNDDSIIVVGASKDSICRIYKLSRQGKAYELENMLEISQGGSITSISFSHDSAFMATANTDRRVFLYNTSDYSKANMFDWVFHTSRVNSVQFSPDDKHIVSGGYDSNVMVYLMENHISAIQILGAHPLSTINRVEWVNDDSIISAGHDACAKLWKLFYDQ